jgi:hypothetical protein
MPRGMFNDYAAAINGDRHHFFRGVGFESRGVAGLGKAQGLGNAGGSAFVRKWCLSPFS